VKRIDQSDDTINMIMLKVKEGKSTPADLFRALDYEGNRDGFVNKDEFARYAKRLGMNLTDHRIDEIFADI
jgi:Ca2+-binding EF-hand superfamily protein